MCLPANVGNFPSKRKVVDDLIANGSDTLHDVVDVALWRLFKITDRDQRFYTLHIQRTNSELN